MENDIKNHLALSNDDSFRQVIEAVYNEGELSNNNRTGVPTRGLSFIPSFYHLTGGLVPMLSGKAVNEKPLLVELEWYLRGEGNIRFMSENGVKIWNQWADENGDLGPVYGKQWRKWRDTRVVTVSEFEEIKHRGYVVDGELTDGRLAVTREIDQLQRIVDNLRNDPENRRNIMSAWNVGELEDMQLPPCHFAFGTWSREVSPDQRFYIAVETGANHFAHGIVSKYSAMISDLVDENGALPDLDTLAETVTHEWLDARGIPRRVLNTGMVQRSVDTFVGMPFNIAGYGILTHYLAHITDHMADNFTHFGFDVHLYSNHEDGFKEYTGRREIEESYPVVVFPESWKELSDFNWQEIQILGYQSHDWIKVPVAK
ncbi:thymidylate synthase [Morganella psychrotolerans]|uniref:thymidylate synthase n=1 Tax=Morganella psychrotolerans TaxID=368603 RepID=A0A5M9QYA5_9GAMM|nr:thymidylate synthase [Morganella psychrotolerans]KAA8712989.1 thymidylate synthase [Morganella psychrotolerans]OBU01910.1 thymidylate synthase [Morganella psychrotolerans]